jgi:hypothetical protein
MRTHFARLHAILQHQLLRVLIQVHLLVYPRGARHRHARGNRAAIRMVLEQRQWNDQGQKALQ